MESIEEKLKPKLKGKVGRITKCNKIFLPLTLKIRFLLIIAITIMKFSIPKIEISEVLHEEPRKLLGYN